MLKKALSAVTLSAVAATVMLAASAQAADNPLHPSFYQAKASQVETKTSDAARYVDSRNPLSAAFSRTGEVKWMTTSDRSVAAYVDSRNPLSPSFKR
ncbi:MAG: hypothetical protein M3Q00_01250 [Pseudomonadota bacterium]|nr:hypothetical protein [Pseudomonadota bacterium]